MASRLGPRKGMSCFLYSHLRLVQAARGAVVGAVLSGNHGGGGVGRGMSCFLHSHLRLVQAARGAVSGAVLSGNHGGIGVSGLSRVSYGLGLHLAHLPLSGNYAVGSGLPRCFCLHSRPNPAGRLPLPSGCGGLFNVPAGLGHVRGMCGPVPNPSGGGNIWDIINEVWYHGFKFSFVALIWYFYNFRERTSAEIYDLEVEHCGYENHLKCLERMVEST